MSREKFIEAVEFATDRHKFQKRKLDQLPYILHCMEVAAIIGTMTIDDDVLIAGFLHDAAEDTDTSLAEIGERFGSRVLALVTSETENKRDDLPAEATWKIRKEESLQDLKNTDDIDIKRLWLADKLANMRSIWHSWLKEGDELFNAFHQKDKKEHEWYYRSIAEYVSELSDTAAYLEYVRLVDTVFE